MVEPYLSLRVKSLLIASIFLMLSAIGNADQTDEIYALIEQDKLSDAMRQTKSMLAESPEDPSLLFAQAIIAEKNGSPKDAIRIYQGLTLSHPELLEPFNNLAIHYARAGDYKAAISTLELAMQVHPSVATAYRNLTAIYEQLASAAYRKALNSDAPLVPLELASLEKIDTSTPSDIKEQPRLVASVESYLSESLGTGQSAADEATSKVSIEIDIATVAEESAQMSADPAPPKEPAQVSEVETASPEPAVVVETEKVIEPSEPEPEPEPEPVIVAAVTPTAEARQAAEDIATQKQALIDQVKSWANAWSDRDVDRYLSHYSGSFKPRDNLTLEDWKKQRYGRLRWREFIIVKPSEYSISVDGDSATVNFSQYYKSERFEDTIRKTLKLKKEKGTWLITRELI